VVVNFTPRAKTNYNADIVFSYTKKESIISERINIRGNGIYPGNINLYDKTTVNQITSDPLEMSFEDTAIGISSELIFSFKNDGDAEVKDLLIDPAVKAAFPASISLIYNKCNKPLFSASETCKVKLEYTPTIVESINFPIKFTYFDLVETKSIEFDVKAAAFAAPIIKVQKGGVNTSSHTFGLKRINDGAVSQAFTLKNTGLDKGTSITLTSNNDFFTISGDSCTGATLDEAGGGVETCDFTVNYNPTSDQNINDEVSIIINYNNQAGTFPKQTSLKVVGSPSIASSLTSDNYVLDEFATPVEQNLGKEGINIRSTRFFFFELHEDSRLNLTITGISFTVNEGGIFFTAYSPERFDVPECINGLVLTSDSRICAFSLEWLPTAIQDYHATLQVSWNDDKGNPGTPVTIPVVTTTYASAKVERTALSTNNANVSYSNLTYTIERILKGESTSTFHEFTNVGAANLVVQNEALTSTHPNENSLSINGVSCSDGSSPANLDGHTIPASGTCTVQIKFDSSLVDDESSKAVDFIYSFQYEEEPGNADSIRSYPGSSVSDFDKASMSYRWGHPGKLEAVPSSEAIATYNFGYVLQDTTATKAFSLKNTGDFPTSIGSFTWEDLGDNTVDPSYFNVIGATNCSNVSPGATCSSIMTFTPSATEVNKEKTVELTINYFDSKDNQSLSFYEFSGAGELNPSTFNGWNNIDVTSGLITLSWQPMDTTGLTDSIAGYYVFTSASGAINYSNPLNNNYLLTTTYSFNPAAAGMAVGNSYIIEIRPIYDDFTADGPELSARATGKSTISVTIPDSNLIYFHPEMTGKSGEYVISKDDHTNENQTPMSAYSTCQSKSFNGKPFRLMSMSEWQVFGGSLSPAGKVWMSDTVNSPTSIGGTELDQDTIDHIATLDEGPIGNYDCVDPELLIPYNKYLGACPNGTIETDGSGYETIVFTPPLDNQITYIQTNPSGGFEYVIYATNPHTGLKRFYTDEMGGAMCILGL
jgi:hypothetical protein